MHRTLFILLLVFHSAIWAQSKKFTLSEAKQYAYENSLAVKNAELGTQTAALQRKETIGIGLPQMNLEGTFNQFINLPVQVVDASFINPNAAPGETISFRAGTDFSAAGTFQASQILFNGSYLVGLQVSEQYIAFSKVLERQSMEEVIFSVIQAYNLVSVARENLVYVDSMVALTQKLVAKQQNYLELGLMKEEEMDQLNYALLSAKNAQSNAAIQYQNAKVMLKLTMNYPMDQELELAESSDELLSLFQVGNGNLSENLEMKVLDGQLTLNQYALKNQKFSNLPSLNAFFQHTYNAFRNEFDFFSNNQWFQQTFWGLQLSIPVFSGGQRHYKIQQAQVEVMKTENNKALLENALRAREMQALNNLSASRSQYEMQKSNVALAEKIYRNALIKQEVGSESSILVTQKYNQLIQAQSQMTASKIDYFNAKLNLEKLYNRILTQ